MAWVSLVMEHITRKCLVFKSACFREWLQYSDKEPQCRLGDQMAHTGQREWMPTHQPAASDEENLELYKPHQCCTRNMNRHVQVTPLTELYTTRMLHSADCRYLNWVLVLIGWGKGENVTSAWCDPIRHVSSCSREECLEVPYQLLYFTLLLADV